MTKGLSLRLINMQADTREKICFGTKDYDGQCTVSFTTSTKYVGLASIHNETCKIRGRLTCNIVKIQSNVQVTRHSVTIHTN